MCQTLLEIRRKVFYSSTHTDSQFEGWELYKQIVIIQECGQYYENTGAEMTNIV